MIMVITTTYAGFYRGHIGLCKGLRVLRFGIHSAKSQKDGIFLLAGFSIGFFSGLNRLYKFWRCGSGFLKSSGYGPKTFAAPCSYCSNSPAILQ